MQRYYLGIDASKGYADYVILDANKVIVQRNFQLDDTFNGHCCLTERLRLFFKKHPDAQLYAAIESTGGYEKNWLNTLSMCRSAWNIKTARVLSYIGLGLSLVMLVFAILYFGFIVALITTGEFRH